MDSELLSFVNKYKDAKDYYTHTSQLANAGGRYKIEAKDEEDFWKLYCNLLYKKGEAFIAGMSERPLQYMPILADVDISFSNNEKTEDEATRHFYTVSQLKNIAEIYMDVLKHIVVGWKPEHMICFVLEKSKPYKKDVRYKNGFHLHFPWLYLSQVDQQMHVQTRVIERVEQENVFANLGITHSGDNIDKDIYKKHWLLYGSRKSASNEAYKLTKIYDHTMNEISLEDCFNIHRLYNSQEEEISIDMPLTYYLPRLLSVQPTSKPGCVFTCRMDIDLPLKHKLQKAADNKKVFENMKLPDVVAIARDLMKLINVKRADHHDTWMHVGWTLYNITDGCQEGLDMWVEFSKNVERRTHVDESRCIFEWNKMEKRNITLGCLRYLARIDNPDGYREYEEKMRNERIKESLNGGQNSLAKQLYDLVGDYFVCANVTKNLWYEFKNHRWVESDAGIALRQRITTDILPRFNAYRVRLEEEARLRREAEGVEIGEQEKEEHTQLKKDISALMAKLNSANFKKGIITECQEYFYNEEFLKKIDSNPYLIGFNNGVLDLKYCEFRDGDPTDYVSMSTGYDYECFNWEEPEVQEVETILIKLFPDEILRQYILEYCARLLKGGNDAKTFNCWTGVGDNGKSVLIDMIEKSLGRYAIKFPTTLLTGKRTQSSAASPELARTHAVRFAVVQEPDGNDVINAGLMKELTGNDSFFVRGLYNAGGEIKPMFKLALICNRLPRLSAEDQATWNRVRVVPFESRFPKNKDEVPDEWEDQLAAKVFYRDETLGERMDMLKKPFMWLLVETYKRCSKYGWSSDPEKVLEATNNYRKTNDFFLQFISECCKQDKQSHVVVHLTELYASFKTWFASTYTGIKCPGKNDLKTDLDKRWGTCLNGRYNGWRLRTIQDDEEEGRAQVVRDSDRPQDDEDEDW